MSNGMLSVDVTVRNRDEMTVRKATRSATLADLVTLAVAVDRDEQLSAAEVVARDRSIADELAERRGSRFDDTRLWLRAVCQREPALRDVQARVDAGVRATTVAAVVIGAVLGLLAALGAFYYDGAGRVNVVGIVAIFVLAPVLLLIPLLLAAAPTRWVSLLPGLTPLTLALRDLSPGRLATASLRVLPPQPREAMNRILGRMGSHRRQYTDVQKWTVLRWSQMVAVGFQSAAVLAAIAVILFTDIAFGWSTTLTSGNQAADAATVHRLTSGFAAPWSWLWPDAVPSLDLVATTRYFRVTRSDFSVQEAARLGEWWRFVLMAIVVYGLAPRVVALIVTGVQLRRAIHGAMVAMPGMDAILRRLRLARVRTEAAQPDTDEAARSGDLAAFGDAPPIDARVVINWSGTPASPEYLPALTGAAGAPVVYAGGTRTLQEDRETVAGLGPGGEGRSGIVILVKAWEPPVHDLMDFLELLRGHIDRHEPIVLVPIGLDAHGQAAAPAMKEVRLWRNRAATTGDPWLRVSPPRNANGA